jgi:hypothetical protein
MLPNGSDNLSGPNGEGKILEEWRNIPEDGILHSHRREHLKSYIALSGWALKWRGNVSPEKYELSFYIPEDGILHSHLRENLKS